MEIPKDIQEVEILRENIRWLQNVMPKALNNWNLSRKKSNINCEAYPKVVKEICYKPGLLNPNIFDPLLKWLYDYELNREGKIAFPGPKGLDTFLKLGIRNIYNFVFISDFFSRNPDFFIPDFTGAGIKKQQEYQDFINTLNSKLIGCNEKLAFIFLKLSKTVKNLPEDLKAMQKYLDDHCISLRIRELKK
jgi:hypothetical protein